MAKSPYRSPSRVLGPIERRHASPAPTGSIGLVFVLFGLPGLALLSGFQSAPGQTFAGDRMTNGAIGAGLLAVAACTIVMLVRKAVLSVDVHLNGLLWHERGLARAIPWNEIVEIRGAHVKRLVSGFEAARTSVYRLQLENGRELVATNMLAGVHDLIDRIERELLERLQPQTRANLEAGRTAHFGPVSLSARGVELGDAVIAWSDLRSVEVADGTLIVRGREQDPLHVDWSAVPNARVLLAMLEERTSGTAPGPVGA